MTLCAITMFQMTYFVVNNAMGLTVGIWKCTLHSSSLQLRMHSPVLKGETCPHTVGGRPVDYDLQWVQWSSICSCFSLRDEKHVPTSFTASVSHIACIQSHSRSPFCISLPGRHSYLTHSLLRAICIRPSLHMLHSDIRQLRKVLVLLPCSVW